MAIVFLEEAHMARYRENHPTHPPGGPITIPVRVSEKVADNIRLSAGAAQMSVRAMVSADVERLYQKGMGPLARRRMAKREAEQH